MGAMFILMLSGMPIMGSQNAQECVGWILCDGKLIPDTLGGWQQMVHRFLVVLSSGLMLTLLIKVWKNERSQIVLMNATTAAFVLYVSQALLGSKLIGDFPEIMQIIHTGTAAGVWVSMIIVVISSGLLMHVPGDNINNISVRDRWYAKNLLLLTKPVVVALLLVTTFAGMVIGAQSFPSMKIIFWTLLGGFMAAGGSGAINQFIDREDDSKMQRTQKRPIPSGRLTPAEALAFGTAMSIASFYIILTFVNLLAALLALAGIFYYVVIYSIWLKKASTQNIVIGGGAGAIPPLVGWAAATGSINIPAMLLFAVIFLWTPPHFWALALVRRKDYARAGVPMLPVVRGEEETRWQILLYTIGLVILTLCLPFLNLGGEIYLAGALSLGVWLISVAWRMWKQGGNKLAWKMYRYSSMYLAFLVIVLMVDALV
jgi:protoheme IX farnesyltransferase